MSIDGMLFTLNSGPTREMVLYLKRDKPDNPSTIQAIVQVWDSERFTVAPDSKSCIGGHQIIIQSGLHVDPTSDNGPFLEPDSQSTKRPQKKPLSKLSLDEQDAIISNLVQYHIGGFAKSDGSILRLTMTKEVSQTNLEQLKTSLKPNQEAIFQKSLELKIKTMRTQEN